jgi:hypothetical protein
MNLNPEDLEQLRNRGIEPTEFVVNILQLVQQTAPARLEKACTPGDGILVLSPSETHRLAQTAEQKKTGKSIVKFVPASGAATRMFKHLFNYDPESGNELVEEFILQFDRLPFFHALKSLLASKNINLDDLIKQNRWNEIFSFILNKEGLGYANYPKGMVKFHFYPDGARTAFEEHLHEATKYAKEFLGVCKIHFTVSPDHLSTVKNFLIEKAESFEYDEFEIDFSIQDPATDFIALTRDNDIARDDHGQMIFRPSGHGALIRNLQNIEADIIFIKNIDNVTTDSFRGETVFYKHVIAGLLIELKEEINQLLAALENEITEEVLLRALDFIRIWFQPILPVGLDKAHLASFIKQRLDRPLRICGMVKNEGEPGGGPFWVKSSDGFISRQIIERSQVDLHDVQQALLLETATHFNPVDIVCNFKNREGKNFDLQQFVDHSTAFVSEKFHEGKVIKALELPGLWNGAMALWNSVFVEVPVSTFTPVKTVNDLLRPGHQVMRGSA